MKPASWHKPIAPGRGISISLAILLVATLGSTAYLVYSINVQRNYAKRATQSVQAAYVLQDLNLQLQLAESAVRGYYITGNDKYLENFQSAARQVPDDLSQLGRTPSLQDDQSSVGELRGVTTDRMEQLQRGIDRRRAATDLSNFVGVTNFDSGKAQMDKVRNLIADLSDITLKDALPLQSRAAQAQQRSFILAPVVALVVISLCVVIMRYFGKAIERERAIEGSKNEFLSLASHQLRTPATNVKQYVHLVLDGFFGDITPEQRTALETANKNNDIEISIINDLLDVAKLDLNQILITLEPANAGRLVRQVMKDFTGPAKKRGQKLTYRETRGIAKVRLDAKYFKSVVENLIDNASKYSPPHSPISLTGSVVDGMYQLTIADKGVGIPAKEQHRLFKKFSRIPNALSDAVEGSGLGLYWVKRVIELHHGTIQVTSNPNDGTKFTLLLPLAEAPKPN